MAFALGMIVGALAIAFGVVAVSLARAERALRNPAQNCAAEKRGGKRF